MIARTLHELEAEREHDERPVGSTRWARLRGARVDVDQSDAWTMHETPAHILEAQLAEELREAKRLRGDQSEAGHHLGRGTKWIKPRTT